MIRLKKFFFQWKYKKEFRATTFPTASINRSCLEKIREAILPEIEARHEGICYLLGLSNSISTHICSAIRPESITTPGSFEVDKLSMSKVVRKASKNNLQVVGQLHTHPSKAYHSKGDDSGALIAYDGFISIVVPDYGIHLPYLKGAAIYRCTKLGKFEQLTTSQVTIIDSIYS